MITETRTPVGAVTDHPEDDMADPEKMELWESAGERLEEQSLIGVRQLTDPAGLGRVAIEKDGRVLYASRGYALDRAQQEGPGSKSPLVSFWRTIDTDGTLWVWQVRYPNGRVSKYTATIMQLIQALKDAAGNPDRGVSVEVLRQGKTADQQLREALEADPGEDGGIGAEVARRASICSCGHSRALHCWGTPAEPGVECGKCDCESFEAEKDETRHEQRAEGEVEMQEPEGTEL